MRSHDWRAEAPTTSRTPTQPTRIRCSCGTVLVTVAADVDVRTLPRAAVQCSGCGATSQAPQPPAGQ